MVRQSRKCKKDLLLDSLLRSTCDHYQTISGCHWSQSVQHYDINPVEIWWATDCHLRRLLQISRSFSMHNKATHDRVKKLKCAHKTLALDMMVTEGRIGYLLHKLPEFNESYQTIICSNKVRTLSFFIPCLHTHSHLHAHEPRPVNTVGFAIFAPLWLSIGDLFCD